MTVASLAFSGCGTISYLAPSVDVSNARYTHSSGNPNYYFAAVAHVPVVVEFDDAGVNVAVHAYNFVEMCYREAGIGLVLFPPFIPVPFPWWTRDKSLDLLVFIGGQRVSVNPAQVVLRDSKGRTINGTDIGGISVKREFTTVELQTPCDSDTYDVILKGITVDGRAVELPTVHLVRARGWQW